MIRQLRNALAIWLLLYSTAGAADAIEIDNAWIREAPPGAPMLAGYLCLHNPTGATVTLTAVQSPLFPHIMMHRTEIREGMARMMHQDTVDVAAGQRVCFEPGGLHLMMTAPDQPLKAGDQIELVLQFADGHSQRILAPVRAP